MIYCPNFTNGITFHITLVAMHILMRIGNGEFCKTPPQPLYSPNNRYKNEEAP